MKASDLIKRLESLIEMYGDQEVYSGGEDYPNNVVNVAYEKAGDTYVPPNAFRVWCRSY